MNNEENLSVDGKLVIKDVLQDKLWVKENIKSMKKILKKEHQEQGNTEEEC